VTDALQRLQDDAALRDLVAAYAFGLDTGDWDLWRSVFTDEVLIDLTDYEPEPAPQRLPVEVHETYVRRLFAGFDATQHFIGTTRVALDGDRGTVTAHMRAEHWLTSGQGDDRYTMYGTYTDDCVRTDAGWRISSVKLTLLREEGNRHLMRLAARRGREGAP
jgi:3-phenylpropionate/cinnamic acid dioxygenase small subunit